MTRLSSDKDLNNLLNEAVSEGWRAEKTKSDHVRLIAPNGQFVFAPSTIGDRRGLLNLISSMRRAWPEWRVREKPKGEKKEKKRDPLRKQVNLQWDGFVVRDKFRGNGTFKLGEVIMNSGLMTALLTAQSTAQEGPSKVTEARFEQAILRDNKLHITLVDKTGRTRIRLDLGEDATNILRKSLFKGGTAIEERKLPAPAV